MFQVKRPEEGSLFPPDESAGQEERSKESESGKGNNFQTEPGTKVVENFNDENTEDVVKEDDKIDARSIHNDEELESSDTEPEDKAEESDEETDDVKKNEAANSGQQSSTDEKGGHGEDGSSWTLRLDKEIKDLENSAIASSKYLSHGLGLEDSLKNIENSLKNTQSRIAGYTRPGDNPETKCEEKEEIEDSTTTSAGVCGTSKRREATPPHIAVALKEAATMREEAKKR